MAKRKGKSKQRIDWHARYEAGDEDSADHKSKGKLTKRKVKLPPRDLEVGQENTDDLSRREGMVVGMFPGGAEVRIDQSVMLCMIAKAFRAPNNSTALTVGDTVTVATSRQGHHDASGDDPDRADGMIISRGPRKTALSRPTPRSGKHHDEYKSEVFERVIAANMDALLIIAATCQPPLRTRLIQRYLIIAERGEMEPILVLNKIDLAPPDPEVIEHFRESNLVIVKVSANTGQGIDELTKHLTGRRSILAGASGVGKSTLINRLIPGVKLATRTVRPGDLRGRHTTSSASVYELPDGGMLVDTPGIRELGLPIDTAELPWYFPEFERFTPDCKFNNCTHTHEPECAVIQAVEDELIPINRFETYLQLLSTLEES
ncbi:MAG: ribosome small subunit-dependent GTPase A [bacterium]|nr:ribosome small subunit-dependent GTPase A [bacterium]